MFSTRRRSALIATVAALLALPPLALAQIAPGPHYKLIVTTYPWITSNYPYTVPQVSVRCPEQSDSSCTYFNGQDTTAYGSYIANLAQTRNIDVLSTLWHYVDPTPFNNFQASLTSVNFTSLRIAYMVGLHQFCTQATAIEAQVKSWATCASTTCPAGDASNPLRYAHLTDTAGNSRPIILIWGDEANLCPNTFATFVANVRSHFQTTIGKNPFFIMTQHGLWSGNDQIIRNVDAFYEHDIWLPLPSQTATTWQSMLNTEGWITGYISQLANKYNYSTGLKVEFIPGAYPQFDRSAWSPGSHGVVEASCRLQALEMMKMVRSYAPTLGGNASWAVMNTLNEWVEGGTLEPSKAGSGFPNGYPGGSYNYDLVNGLSQVFGPLAMSVDFAQTDTAAGLSRPAPEPGDGQTTSAFVWSNNNGFVTTRYNNATPTAAEYVYVKADDLTLHDGSDLVVDLTVCYVDHAAYANSQFVVSYDSVTDDYKNTPAVNLVGDGTRKCATWRLSDVQFANPQGGGSDFRIVSYPYDPPKCNNTDGCRVYIDSVKVAKVVSRRSSNPCP